MTLRLQPLASGYDISDQVIRTHKFITTLSYIAAALKAKHSLKFQAEMYTLRLRSSFFTALKLSTSAVRLVHSGEYFTRGCLDELKLSSSVSLAGRDFLPSSRVPGFPKFLSGPRENAPLYLKAKSEKNVSPATWGMYSREVIDLAFENYQQNGVAVAILFRGLPIRTVQDFSEWAISLKFDKVPYTEPTGLTPPLAESILSGSSEPSNYNIEPHNERAYMPAYPDIFCICMFKKSMRGGETAIVDNRETLRMLDQNFVEKCDRKEVRYWKYLPDEKSSHPSTAYKTWQHQFRSNDKAQVETELKDSEIDFEWHKDGNLVNLLMWYNRSPFIRHPKTGEQLWFNQIVAGHCSYVEAMPSFCDIKLPNVEYPHHCTYGDGEEIELDMVDDVRRIKWQNAMGFEWQEGDVLFLDNLIMQHSRLSFEGERKMGITLLNMN